MAETGLMTLLQQVLAEAAEQVNNSGGDLEGLDGANLKARMAFQALSLAESKRRSYRSVQASIVVKMMRESQKEGPLWLAYPPTQDYPTGFGSLKEFLTAAGIGRSTVHDLNTLGMCILPYCDEHNISIEPYITEQRYPLLVEASTSLKHTIGDDGDVQEILNDVMTATGRDSIRAKYRQPRAKIGDGSVNYLDDDRAVVVVLLPSMDEVSVVLSKLAGVVSWDTLVTATRQRRRSIQVTVNDPK